MSRSSRVASTSSASGPKRPLKLVPGPAYPPYLLFAPDTDLIPWLQLDYLAPSPRGRLIRLAVLRRQHPQWENDKGIVVSALGNIGMKNRFSEWKEGRVSEGVTQGLEAFFPENARWLTDGSGEWRSVTPGPWYSETLQLIDHAVSGMALLWLTDILVGGVDVPDELAFLKEWIGPLLSDSQTARPQGAMMHMPGGLRRKVHDLLEETPFCPPPFRDYLVSLNQVLASGLLEQAGIDSEFTLFRRFSPFDRVRDFLLETMRQPRIAEGAQLFGMTMDQADPFSRLRRCVETMGSPTVGAGRIPGLISTEASLPPAGVREPEARTSPARRPLRARRI